MRVFHSLSDALKAGYQIVEKNELGYLVRTRTFAGWAMAVVELPELAERQSERADRN